MAILPSFTKTRASKTMPFHIFRSHSSRVIYKPQLQVFWSIIVSYTVFVMDGFSRFKISTKYAFHDNAMFRNTAVFIASRVFRSVENNIAIPTKTPSTFPVFCIPQFSMWSRFQITYSAHRLHSIAFFYSRPQLFNSNNFFCSTCSAYSFNNHTCHISMPIDSLTVPIKILSNIFREFVWMNRTRFAPHICNLS